MHKLITLVIGLIALAFTATAKPNRTFLPSEKSVDASFEASFFDSTNKNDFGFETESNPDIPNPISENGIYSSLDEDLFNILFTIDDITGNIGDNICLDVSVDAFVDITSFQFSMMWDPTGLSFTGIQNTNLTALTVGGSFNLLNTDNGIAACSWFDPQTTGVTLVDGHPIYQICFDIISTAGAAELVSFTGSPTVIEVTDTSGELPFNSNPGQITVTDGGGGTSPANVEFSIESQSVASGDAFCLDVTTDNFTDVTSFQYSVSWNPSQLSFTGLGNINSTDIDGLNAGAFNTANTSSGQLSTSWFDNTTLGVDVPSGTVLFQLCFEAMSTTTTTSAVSFSNTPTVQEVTTTAGEATTDYNAGTVSITGGGGTGGGGNVAFTVENQSVTSGDAFCLDVTTDNFTDVTSFQYSMSWNTSQLSFTGLANINSTDIDGLNAGAFNTANTSSGQLSTSWFDNTTLGVDIPDGTVLFQLCFEAVGSTTTTTAVSFSNTPTVQEVTTTAGEATTDYNAGTVSITGGGGTGGGGNVAFTVENQSVASGDAFCLDVTVDNFTDVTSFQYSMSWNTSQLSFTGLANINSTDIDGLNAGAFNTVNTSSGQLSTSWFDNTTLGVDIPDGTVLFQLCFEAVSGSTTTSTISFSNTPTVQEVTTTAGEATTDYNAGAVSITGGGGTGGGGDIAFTVENQSVESGDAFCLDVTVDNFTNVTSFQYSMSWNTSQLSFTGLANINSSALAGLDGGSFNTNSTSLGQLSTSWFDNTTLGLDVPDGTVLYQVCFEAVSSTATTATVSFSNTPTVQEVTTTSGVVTTDYNAGTVNITSGGGTGGGGDVTFNIESATVSQGQSFCLDVTTDNFTDVTSFQYSISWNTSHLSFTGLANINSTEINDLNAGAFNTMNASNGQLSTSWFDNTTLGIDLPNGILLFQLCFEAVGASASTTAVAFANLPTVQEVTTSTGEEAIAIYNNGSVTFEAGGTPGDVQFSFPTINIGPDDTSVCVPLSVTDFININTFQFTMNWDPTVLTFDAVQDFNLPFLGAGNFGITNTNNLANGQLTMSWNDDNADGETINGTEPIVELCFTVIGDCEESSSIFINGFPTALEVADVNANILNPILTNGSVNIGCVCDPIIISGNQVTNESCFGANDGAINVNVSGGDGSFQYTWTRVGSGVIANTQDISNLQPGNYTFGVTSCNGSEIATASFTVTGAANGITAFEAIQSVDCFGGQDGSISISATGGTGALTYSWSGGNLPTPTTGSTISGLIKAFYTVTITDANNCSISETYSVTQPAAALTISPIVTNVSCNGDTNGSIDVNAQNGWGGYTYNWSPNVTGSNLAPGIYSVTVEDIGGCEISANNIQIGEPSVISISAFAINISPPSTPMGSINMTPAGGTGANTYTYSWTGPNNFVAATEDIGGLTEAGDYCVIVTDANNCTATDCFTIESPLGVTLTETQPSCAGECNGFINLNTFGGQGTISYSWTNANNEPLAFVTEDISGLCGGTYNVLVTDQDGAAATLSIDVAEAANIVTVNPTVTDLSAEGASDGSIETNASGGFGGYTYSWSPNGEVTAAINNLSAGSYTVTVTDIEGCSIIETYNISYTAEPLVATVQNTDASCNGVCDGLVTVTIVSGAGGYNYILQDATGTPIAPPNDTGIFENVCAQDFTVLITDAAGQFELINDVVSEPAPLAFASITVFPVTIAGSNNGAICVEVEGGTAPYTYAWAGVGPCNTNLNVWDNYDLTVTDANGCTITVEDISVQLFEVTGETINNVECQSDTNGSICAPVVGGNGDYSFAWNNGETTECINNLVAGGYSVTITDVASGVSITELYTVTTQSTLAIAAEPTSFYSGGFNVSCFGREDGAARVAQMTGAQGNTSFAWSNGVISTDETITGLAAGIYTVTVTDDLCDATAQVTIVEPEPFTVGFQATNITCAGERDGVLCAVPNGGANTNVDDYDYEWTGAGIVVGGVCVNNLAAGSFSVLVVDENGCEASASTDLLEPAPITVVVETTADQGESNGTVSAMVTGGSGIYTYDWRNNGSIGTTQELTGLAAGEYVLIVTDSNGCSVMVTDVIVADNSLGCLETRVIVSPDNDGFNEEFVISCIENFPDNHLEIYNRWGQLVFEQDAYDCGTDNCENGWKGLNIRDAELPKGAYFFVFEYKEENVTKQLKGSITLLR